MIYVGKGGASAAPGRGVSGGVLTLLISVRDTSYTCPDLALGGLPARLFFRCFYLLLGLCLSVFSWSFMIERVEISACRLDIFQPVEADVFLTQHVRFMPEGNASPSSLDGYGGLSGARTGEAVNQGGM